ncbi:hypothetical protein HS1genome_1241 [Sulfodiicoccus acidiphilus]|uniref:4Fe-4S ferredoxin-type domain-containing protein n=1 Tax=Sulfodiicoccus acidiphilus TaxID=1670455 RepID=A0A348B3V0_9CREN|nr:FAD-dependent oxidoreductase [Sulfodiicoccus acidiphilus]BBD72852.1 hypothetical protein HS1genome_1241 [Sulfodiicoccus acidiphilus]GGT88488.1 hypothetical protein GCM10007116_03110 [Sulfodiicoccus acidiphilus]
MTDKYDVIVVGAGVGGSAAALYLAKKGYDVMLLEKGMVPGQKNLTGGVLYGSFVEGYGLIDLVPEFEKEAPLERRVIDYRLVLLSSPVKSGGKFQYKYLDSKDVPLLHSMAHRLKGTGHDYTVHRARFDKWLASKVEQAGGLVVTGTAVEDLLWRDGKVVGVRTTKEDVEADVVIDASGVTSKLVIKAGLREPLSPEDVYHGVKFVFELGESEIESRFGLAKGEGIAMAVMGDFLHGMKGGGFLYTDKSTISFGIAVDAVSMLKSLRDNVPILGKPVDVVDEMASHPYFSKYLEGAKLVEYGAHNIPKGYRTFLERPFIPGFMVVGDALGAFVKLGAVIDGMRRAIASGIMAAVTYEQARKRGEFSQSLSLYKELLKPLEADISRYRAETLVSESDFLYGRGYTSLLQSAGKVGYADIIKEPPTVDSQQRIQSLTATLSYNEDKEWAHINVSERADEDQMKMWIPACPANCYTLLVEGKGVFASFRDLYKVNLSKVRDPGEAAKLTWSDVRQGKVRFDYVPCVACGTCWVIGPKDVIDFNPERQGHGVKYSYG